MNPIDVSTNDLDQILKVETHSDKISGHLDQVEEKKIVWIILSTLKKLKLLAF